MPFTFSHPAIVLPMTYLPHRWISMTGLVIGSLSPDFEYFLRMKIQGNYSHYMSGLFWLDLPTGLLLAFLFHTIIKDSLFEQLPSILKSRFLKYNGFAWSSYFLENWYIVIISLLTGAVSHLLWDSFTHFDGYFVQNIPALTKKIEIANRQIPVFKILQHSSTLIGGLVIAFAFWKLPSDKNVKSKFNLKYWGILTSFTLIIIAIRVSCGLDYKHFGNLIVTCISGIFISAILIPVITKIRGICSKGGLS